ncbi:MAG: DNA (cytosine-5-)-methyltransferase [Myxococcales bacterium]|nr:MAG: DNA (cytosine-5-)-methyltransferase [Myxococcales bacterium]
MKQQNGQLGFYEFFAGVGLAGLGLGKRWTRLWANDIDPRKGEIFARNFGEGSIRIDDVSNVKASELPGPADLAWASFPCQDLSLAGWRRGMTAEHSGAFWEFWRIIRELQNDGRAPKLLAIENVVGLLYGESFTGLCEALASLGYRFGAVVIDAKHFVPQSRPRVFIVAIDQDLDVSDFRLGAPPVKASLWHPPTLVKTVKNFDLDLKARWIWWNLPKPMKNGVSLAKIITDPDAHDPSWFSNEEVARLLGLMNDLHRKRVESAKAKNGTLSVLTVYKRMRRGEQRAEVRDDNISGCLRVPGGGSSRQTVIIVRHGKVKARLMSRRELARLMGAPDSFWLPTHYNNTYRAMGDAVAVPAVRWLADRLLTPLAQRLGRASEIVNPRAESSDRYLNRSLQRMEAWRRNGMWSLLIEIPGQSES